LDELMPSIASHVRAMGFESLTLTVLAAAMVPGLAGCQVGRAYILQSPAHEARYSQVMLKEGESTAPISPEFRSFFEQSLTRKLEREAGFAIGGSTSSAGTTNAISSEMLTIQYRQVLNDEGSGPARVGAAIVSVTGVPTGAVGMGQLAIEVVYLDSAGNVLARIIADGPLDGPFATSRNALATAATTIADYTKKHFKCEEGATMMRTAAAVAHDNDHTP
jgi:hypothetical protein